LKDESSKKMEEGLKKMEGDRRVGGQGMEGRVEGEENERDGREILKEE
jgi:hypothetical protein